MSKLALILFLGTSNKLMAAGVISAVAAATGFSVRIFAAFYGLLALTKKGLTQKIDSDFKELKNNFFKITEEKGLPNGLELLKKAKEAGDTKIYA